MPLAFLFFSLHIHNLIIRFFNIGNIIILLNKKQTIIIFSVVKEEIIEDSAHLPCFNGRVVSWVSHLSLSFLTCVIICGIFMLSQNLCFFVKVFIIAIKMTFS